MFASILRRHLLVKKFKLAAKLVKFEKSRLLEIDSQEKIRAIADRLAAYAES
jgi:hypothetical protein